MSEVSVVFDLSASNNLIAPSLPIVLPVLSENEMKQWVLQLRSSEVIDELDLSTLDNSSTSVVQILLSVLSENETKEQVHYILDRAKWATNLVWVLQIIYFWYGWSFLSLDFYVMVGEQ